jgi:type I restriction enzyme, S subunit
MRLWRHRMAIQNQKIKYCERWGAVSLNDVSLKITDGTHHTPTYTKTGVAFISVKDIYNGLVHFDNCKFIEEESHFQLIQRCNPEKGDLLVTKSGTIGRMAIVPSRPPFSLFVSVALIKIKKQFVDANFLKLYMEYFFTSISIDQDIKGGLLKNFHLEDIRATEIPAISITEQHRIVAKIEELFSSLDKGIENLKTAQQQLKVYRQSVLKWAFEGRLTNKDVEDGELPEGWGWKDIKAISSTLGDGLHGTPMYSENGDFFFINGNNLSEGKIIMKENTKRVPYEEYRKYKKPLNDRTILVSINGTLGNTAFYNNEKVILGKSACYLNLLETINKHYVRYCITSHRFINYANGNATGSTIKNVGLKAMRAFEIPMPPTLEEQQAIVSEIESRLSVCDKIEETIIHNLNQAESLRQSILKKAFEGKLVPQDPNDEPAGVLLERIRRERDAVPSARTKKTRPPQQGKSGIEKR